ncbi:expressed unknown protein [Seminavis robusta]|uniref:Uncharacterized protein n=1 Tax=Seminavis robusta TaxID=568900 RepID=A0A9N8F2Z2_9STRA|nr:expressed unknown protein [Seminavis robusta]|eukprot:Sro2843_g338330.1 n/a (292) ;mRNA; f:7336-8211
MAYRMPNGYSNEGDDDYDSQDDESVAISVDIDSEYEGSDGEYSEAENNEEEDNHRHRRGGGHGKGPPRRSKSFQEDHLRGSHSGQGRDSHHHHGREGGRRPPPRSKTFDGGHNSMRSLGGPRMPRRENSKTKLDKEAIASNRARRLRAMGESTGDRRVQLLRRSQSFKGDKKSGASLTRDKDDEEKKDEGRRAPRRPNSKESSALPEEDQQYARTAARGVTRSKSLKAERPNLTKQSSQVMSRLNKMKGAGPGKEGPSSRHRTRESKSKDGNSEVKKEAAAASPKATGLQW